MSRATVVLALASAALLAPAFLAPVAAAEDYDVHVGALETASECQGERSTEESSWDDGAGGSGSWGQTTWAEQCDIDDDVVAARASRDGETIAGARVGRQFEGDSWGDSSWSEQTTANGTSSSGSSSAGREGVFRKGAEAEVAGERASLSYERCEGSEWESGWSWDSPDAYAVEQSGEDKRCAWGVFARASDQEAGLPVGECVSWHHAWQIQDGPSPEGDTNGTMGYRSCRVGQEFAVDGGPRAGAEVWAGHAEDCTGAWNGTAHETQCSWWTGEWTSARVWSYGLLWVDEEYGMPYDVTEWLP